MDERVTLGVMSAADAEDVMAILRNDEVKKTYMLPDLKDASEAMKLFERLKELSENDEHYVRGIYLGGRLIGFINDTEVSEDSIELGWAENPEYFGRGYMTAAVGLAISELFEGGFREVCAGAFEENAASMRVMEKNDMERIPRIDEIEYRGEVKKCLNYRVVR